MTEARERIVELEKSEEETLEKGEDSKREDSEAEVERKGYLDYLARFPALPLLFS